MDLKTFLQQSGSNALGEEIKSQFGDLPFLLKVLSIGRPLSIQIHPDKQTAAKLHQQNSVHYPDSNHKPEMAVALGPFEALCGFCTLDEINQFLSRFDELPKYLKVAKITDESDLQQLCINLFTMEQKELQTVIINLQQQIEKIAMEARTEKEQLFLQLVNDFGFDTGCIFAFLLNYFQLKEGESIFIGPNVPHAYISGEIVECMASSDNVIRAGLTKKYKDADTLLSILSYETVGPASFLVQPVPIFSYGALYDAPVAEFKLVLFKFTASHQEDSFGAVDGPAILLGIDGAIQINMSDWCKTITSGSVYFVAAGTTFNLKSLQANSTLFCAYCSL